ncbi:MAG: hypothetical protein IJF90_13295 [Synergistaceae bacterium]|nr:hypothetical protein [Synergistaceae bacterium]MBQ3347341.1 hypothetical protein [Synergistaceae bacterium]MBQ3759474.1 hypothetical protein [Synergistaceae bacterium]MBQ6115312.1 hypothetical protein [Synergistaceae bacterium]MBQ6418994.1 hypothetical protein [Synergistaceae bacterium]
MKKLAVLSLLVVMFAAFSTESYAIVPGGCVPNPDDGSFLRLTAGVIWGTAKGCWFAYFAPEGEKVDSFIAAFKDGLKDCTSQEKEESPWWLQIVN